METKGKVRAFVQENKIPLGILGGIVAVSLGFLLFRSPPGQVATLQLQGEFVKEINLTQVTEPYTIFYGDPEGAYNKVWVGPGSIGVLEASCPDQICVLQGFSQGEGKPIVCLPHQFLITFSGEEYQMDGISG